MLRNDGDCRSPPRALPGATDAIVTFARDLRFEHLDPDVRHAAKRHLIDTIGVMIAGAGSDVAIRAAAALAAVRTGGDVPVPGCIRRVDLLDAAFLGGTAAHGMELDDGYRQGSVHPGAVVVPPLLALAHAQRCRGPALLTALVAGYETAIAIARACHPQLRLRGFHPTAAVGVFGSAVAAAALRGLPAARLAQALGIAASSAAGLFAFVNGGADIKRLHAGHAAREGLQAVLLAEQGVEGPPNVIEATDGFAQAFAFGPDAPERSIALPPAATFGITDCYVKPYPCCRHLQPAVEALMQLVTENDIAVDEVERIAVETYRIAAAHAAVGWDDAASAQLSFPYVIGLGLRFRDITLEHFDAAMRSDPAFHAIAQKLEVTAPPEIDRRYPALRPARVTVVTPRGHFTRTADEALGSRLVPFSDARLAAKFTGLVSPVLGPAGSQWLLDRLWAIEDADDMAPINTAMVPADNGRG
jgi:2-methylcitrate dehydratase PrpD